MAWDLGGAPRRSQEQASNEYVHEAIEGQREDCMDVLHRFYGLVVFPGSFGESVSATLFTYMRHSPGSLPVDAGLEVTNEEQTLCN